MENQPIYTVEQLMGLEHEQASNILIEALKSGRFEMQHPETGVTTYCRQNKRYKKANVILFSDESGEQPWYLVQIYNLADGYISEKNVLNPLNAGEIKQLETLLKTNELQFDLTCKTSKVSGLIFSQVRPYHYIYDQLVNYFALSKLINLDEYAFTDENCFYSEMPGNKRLKLADAEGCYLFPCTLEGRYDSIDAQEMHNHIFGNIETKEFDSDLVLWFGITAQKRSWVEQVEGCVKIIKRLKKQYNSITVLLDGWTALDGGVPDRPKDIQRDNAVFSAIKAQIGGIKGVELINLVGKDYKEKVAFASSCHAFVANSGSGGIVPMMIANKTGVIHTNGRLHTFERSYDSRIKVVPDDKLTAQDHAIDAGVYSVHWSVVYNLLADILNITDRVNEPRPVSSGMYFTWKRFVFKKSIQAGMLLNKFGVYR